MCTSSQPSWPSVEPVLELSHVDLFLPKAHEAVLE